MYYYVLFCTTYVVLYKKETWNLNKYPSWPAMAVTYMICISLLIFTDPAQSLRYPPCPMITNGVKSHDLYTQHALNISANKVLIKHQIRSSSNVRSEWKCGIKCLLHEDCLSFNYARSSETCQLNDADGEIYPCHLVESTEFDYYTIRNLKETQVGKLL